MTKIIPAVWPEHRGMVEELFREYSISIDVDICFQGFEQELANLPGKYATPHGCVLLVFVEEMLAGCGALRPLDTATCEMKRPILGGIVTWFCENWWICPNAA